MHDILFGYRYLDPSSGALLTQILAAGLLGGIVLFVKVFWARIKAFFKGEKYVPPVAPVDEEDEEDQDEA